MTQENRSILGGVEYRNRIGITQHSKYRAGANSALLEPWLRLKNEIWHNQTTNPFRAGLATTSWQLAQAHSLSGRRNNERPDDALVIMALANIPMRNLGWALATLTLIREAKHPIAGFNSVNNAKVTDIAFSATDPLQRSELLAALIKAAQQAASDVWQLHDIDLAILDVLPNSEGLSI